MKYLLLTILFLTSSLFAVDIEVRKADRNDGEFSLVRGTAFNLYAVCIFSSANDKNGFLHSLVTGGDGVLSMKQVLGVNAVPIKCQRSKTDPLGIR
tara:strand:+ start:92 stop:379 length:288 start_codon:yes stop_codon:yes gene_type:complete